jgi:glycosyltransferase involved in cell wall biosynthesis
MIGQPAVEDSSRRSPTVISVSIIIPTFNRSKLVVKAIESALQQTYKDHEIIVVDDGSTDDTVQALAPYRDRIRYVYQENQGASAAQNKGIEVALGKWVSILASDDRWLPTKLESQFKALAALGEEFGACFTDCKFVGNPLITRTAFQIAGFESHSDFEPLSNPQGYVVAKQPILFVQSMVVLRSLLEKIEEFDNRLIVGEDADLLFRLAFRTRFSVVREPLVEIDGVPSASRLSALLYSMSDPTFECIEYRYKKWLALPELTDPGIRRAVQENLQWLYYTWAVAKIRQHDFSAVREKVRQLRKAGVALPTIILTLFAGVAKKFFSALAGGRKKDSC